MHSGCFFAQKSSLIILKNKLEECYQIPQAIKKTKGISFFLFDQPLWSYFMFRERKLPILIQKIVLAAWTLCSVYIDWHCYLLRDINYFTMMKKEYSFGYSLASKSSLKNKNSHNFVF